jgi:hypothetical protein
MAQLSPPEWKTEDGADQVTTLPCMTLVTFKVTPRSTMKGFHVRYRLHSTRVELTPTAASPPISPTEAEACIPGMPPLTPIRREPRVIEDRYPDVTTATDVTRAIELELSGSEKPAMASLDISVFDVSASGELKNRDDDTVSISFNV